MFETCVPMASFKFKFIKNPKYGIKGTGPLGLLSRSRFMRNALQHTYFGSIPIKTVLEFAQLVEVTLNTIGDPQGKLSFVEELIKLLELLIQWNKEQDQQRLDDKFENEETLRELNEKAVVLAYRIGDLELGTQEIKKSEGDVLVLRDTEDGEVVEDDANTMRELKRDQKKLNSSIKDVKERLQAMKDIYQTWPDNRLKGINELVVNELESRVSQCKRG